jgi:HK97 family phage major capsid protein
MKKYEEEKEIIEGEEEEGEEEEGGDDEETKAMLKSILKEQAEEIKAEVQEHLEKELEKKNKKAGIYSPEVQEKENRKEKNLRFKKLMKAVAIGDYNTAKGIVTKDHTTAATSEIVDTEISFEILHLMEEYGAARQLFRTLALTKHNYKANELDSDVSVAWVDEGNSISSTSVTVTDNTLDLGKLAAIVTMTNELLEDSEVDLIGFITRRVAEQMAKAEDERFLAHDDTGLIYVADVSLELNSASLADETDVEFADKLLDLQGEVSKSVRDRGRYVMSWDMFAKVRKLRDDNNQPLFKHLSEEGPNTIHGKPVVISDVLPSPSDATTAGDPVLMFGDFERGCVLGYKGGIRIDRADSGVVNNNNLFETDRQAVRFVQRSGWVQVLGGTVAVLTTKEAS